MPAEVRDQLNRPLRDLRISVTDRCNFRCPYCMPAHVFGPNHAFLADPQLMTAPELVRIMRAFVALGVQKIRFTGGEPLLRRDLPGLVRSAKEEAGALEVALTSNGWLLEKHAMALRAAGLDRLNVSLDALDETIFGQMNGRGFKPERVLRGIDAALAAGIPLKLNMVVQRGVNESEIPVLAGWARERRAVLRFIEYMDVGNQNGWQRDQVVPAAEIVAMIDARWPLVPLERAHRSEVAARYAYRDGGGEIGLISSVTEPFCGDCSRGRLSADGRLYTCLFASQGHDVLGRLRAGASDAELVEHLGRIWVHRRDRYSEERAASRVEQPAPAKIEMSYIGG